MIKKWYYVLIFIIGLAIAVSGFKGNEDLDYVWAYAELTSGTSSVKAIAPKEEQIEFTHFEIPFSGKSFMAFKQALAFKESQGRYDIVNDFGYMGKYQFGGSALRAVGITNRIEFLNNPVLQEQAFKALLAINKYELRHEIEKYSGKVINGTEITESGILASAHLLGAGSVKRYLRNNGQLRITDGYGTTVRSYMKKFGGYDTSIIQPNPNAKATDNLTKKTVS